MTVATDLRALNAAQTVSETDPFTVRRYVKFAKLIPEAKTVLDVGCNTGRGGRTLRAHLPNLETLHGVELLADRLAAIPAGIYDETFDVRLEELRQPTRYDAILAGEVIEHIPYDSLESFVDATRSLLRPGGVFLLTTPNPHYLLLKRRSGGTVLGGSHLSVHCPVALEQYLRHRGFAVELVQGTGRVSTFLGTRLPMCAYGSYLVKARA